MEPTIDQTRALEALLEALRALHASRSTVNECRVDDAYILCRAMGINFRADGSYIIEHSGVTK